MKNFFLSVIIPSGLFSVAILAVNTEPDLVQYFSAILLGGLSIGLFGVALHIMAEENFFARWSHHCDKLERATTLSERIAIQCVIETIFTETGKSHEKICEEYLAHLGYDEYDG